MDIQSNLEKNYIMISPSNTEDDMAKLTSDKEDFYHLSECEYILKKDSLFDRYIITDFEFEPRADGSLTPYPVCPTCGARRFS